MQAYYDAKPSIYEAVGNGSYLYRWDIKEEPVAASGDEGDGVTRTQWRCNEVTVWSPVTCNAIVKAVLADTWDNNREQKLINEYHSAQMGIYDEETVSKVTEAYKSFLSERAELKAQVENNCKELSLN